MRKVVLYTLMSLDGAVDHPGRYFAGSRSGEAPEFDPAMTDNEAKIIGAQDAVLLGRWCGASKPDAVVSSAFTAASSWRSRCSRRTSWTSCS